MQLMVVFMEFATTSAAALGLPLASALGLYHNSGIHWHYSHSILMVTSKNAGLIVGVVCPFPWLVLVAFNLSLAVLALQGM